MGRKSSRPGRSSEDAESESSRSLRIEQSDASSGPAGGSVQRIVDTETSAAEAGATLGSVGSSSDRVQRLQQDAAASDRSPGGIGSDTRQRLSETAASSRSPGAGKSPSDRAATGANTAQFGAGSSGASPIQRSEQSTGGSGPAGDAGVPDSVRNVISSPGRSLDTSIQRAMEDRMGDSLGDVRIHTGPEAAQACQEINARAFTVGNHVAFNAGEFDPTSPEGQHVLAHELAHVRQQTGGAVSMLPQEDLHLEIDPDPQLEREAEETAQQVMEGGEVGIQRMSNSEVHIQRMSIKSLFGGGKSESGGGGGGGGGGGPTFRSFENGDLGETIATLIQNQQKIIEVLGGKADETTTKQEAGNEAFKESAKLGAGAALSKVPEALSEARELLSDIVSNPGEVIRAVQQMDNPGALAEFMDHVMQHGPESMSHILDALPDILGAATPVGAAIIATVLLSLYGRDIIDAIISAERETVATIKQIIRGDKADAKDNHKSGSGNSQRGELE